MEPTAAQTDIIDETAAATNVADEPSETIELPPARFNLGAFLIPFLWGPANGYWATILYYPLWVFIDGQIYTAVMERSVFAGIISAVMVVAIFAFTFLFARTAETKARIRWIERGKDLAVFDKHQRVWAAAGVIVVIAVLLLATYYNFHIKPTL